MAIDLEDIKSRQSPVTTAEYTNFTDHAFADIADLIAEVEHLEASAEVFWSRWGKKDGDLLVAVHTALRQANKALVLRRLERDAARAEVKALQRRLSHEV